MPRGGKCFNVQRTFTRKRNMDPIREGLGRESPQPPPFIIWSLDGLGREWHQKTAEYQLTQTCMNISMYQLPKPVLSYMIYRHTPAQTAHLIRKTFAPTPNRILPTYECNMSCFSLDP